MGYLSSIFRVSRVSFEYLSSIFRLSFKYLSSIFRVSFEYLSNNFEYLSNNFEYLSIIFRLSFEYLSNNFEYLSKNFEYLSIIFRVSFEYLSNIFRVSRVSLTRWCRTELIPSFIDAGIPGILRRESQNGSTELFIILKNQTNRLYRVWCWIFYRVFWLFFFTEFCTEFFRPPRSSHRVQTLNDRSTRT